MSDGKEEIYSIMFSSLKHPARRKILRILADKPLTFSEMLEILGVSSSNLTYHLDNLGELVTKGENGVYKLSTFGAASVNTMRVVEEAPEVQPRRRVGLTAKWRMVLAVLLVGLIVFAGAAALQSSMLSQTAGERDDLRFKYNQLLTWSSTTRSAIDFLENVVQIDTSHYQATLLSNTVEQRSELGGVLEQNIKVSLASSDSKFDATIRFRNNQFSRYQILISEGTPKYSQTQPANAAENAKGLLGRLSTYESTTYLDGMGNLLSLVGSSVEKIEIKEGNFKLSASTAGESPKIVIMHTENDVDFSPKSLSFTFRDGVLVDMIDGYFLFTVGSTTVNVSAERAESLARNALNGYSWTAEGTTVNNFQIQPNPIVIFHPSTKGNTALYPQYTITYQLDKVYPGGVNNLSVQVWADNGDIAGITR